MVHIMHNLIDNRRTTTHISAMVGSLALITVIHTSPSYAGVINKNNITDTAITITSAAVGAATAAAVMGSVGGPVGSGAAAATAAIAVVSGGVTYTFLNQSVNNPVGTAKVVSEGAKILNPVTGPLYVATHPTSVAKNLSNAWNYLFG